MSQFRTQNNVTVHAIQYREYVNAREVTGFMRLADVAEDDHHGLRLYLNGEYRRLYDTDWVVRFGETLYEFLPDVLLAKIFEKAD